VTAVSTLAVWWAPARLADPTLAALLSPAERERAGRFRRVSDRDRMIAAWALARTLLGDLLGEDPADVAVERHCGRCGSREHGKPRLADASTGVHFSLAHSGDHVLVAVTRAGPVGVDVEQLKPMTDYRRLHRTTLTADEAVALRAAGGRPLDFLRTWVRKEAVTKAVGTGVATPFDSFAVTAPAKPATLLTWPDDPSLVDRTTLLDLPGNPTRPAAVAVLARDVRITEHDGSHLLRAARAHPRGASSARSFAKTGTPSYGPKRA
jgi:4'-phosphopantetheinyl transferase